MSVQTADCCSHLCSLALAPLFKIDYANGEYAIIPHAKFGFLLLGVLSIVIFLFAAFRFKMNRFMSLCFVLIYVMFLIYAFVQELVCDGGKKC